MEKWNSLDENAVAVETINELKLSGSTGLLNVKSNYCGFHIGNCLLTHLNI